MRLALVDGTNAVMRRVMVQVDMPVSQIVRGACLNIGDFVKFIAATHVLVAFDSTTSWRRDEAPEYKADRKTDTSPYSLALMNGLAQLGVRCVTAPGYEADDVIATYATRLRERAEVVTLSSDLDLCALVTNQSSGNGVYTALYQHGGFKLMSYAAVLDKFYHIPTPDLLPQYYAMVGGKNGMPGIAGIGAKGAANRLRGVHIPLIGPEDPSIDTEEFRRAVRLLTLCSTADVPPLTAADCRLPTSFGTPTPDLHCSNCKETIRVAYMKTGRHALPKAGDTHLCGGTLA